jgi:hypothetical protein
MMTFIYLKIAAFAKVHWDLVGAARDSSAISGDIHTKLNR